MLCLEIKSDGTDIGLKLQRSRKGGVLNEDYKCCGQRNHAGTCSCIVCAIFIGAYKKIKYIFCSVCSYFVALYVVLIILVHIKEILD